MWQDLKYKFLKDENAKIWVKYFSLTIIILFSIIFIINFSVDPYGTRTWMVKKQFKPVGNERSEKYNDIFYQKNIQNFDCLILGSSRAMKLAPHENLEIATCYNFSVHMATNREKLFILKEWLKYKKPKHVYLDVDFLNFHQNIEEPQKSVTSKFIGGNEHNYFSIQTFYTSIKALKNSLLKKPQVYFEKDGSINYFQDDQLINNKTYDFSKIRYKKHAESSYKTFFIDKPFIYSKESLVYLKDIQKLCQLHNIQLTVFIPPEEIEYTNRITMDPLLNNSYRNFKKDVVNIFGEIYDFSGNYPENANQMNFYDTWHYRSPLAKKVILRFHGKNQFGTILTSYSFQ